MNCKKPSPSFALTKTCNECPWRKDVPIGRFPPERYIALRRTSEQGMNPLFGCHKTVEGKDVVCVGYLMRDGENNWAVRLAAAYGKFDPQALEAAGPLYDSFEEMARANGVKDKKKKG